jgi:hypothetical protein
MRIFCLCIQYGDTILIHGVKGNHLEIVRALLKKYADVDVQGVVSIVFVFV